MKSRLNLRYRNNNLESDPLARSLLTLDVALRNAVGAALPLEEASRMLSQTPAARWG